MTWPRLPVSAATDEMLTIRPQRVRIIGITSGWVTLKKPFDRDVDDALPLLRAHRREDGVVVHAGVVDDDLDRRRPRAAARRPPRARRDRSRRRRPPRRCRRRRRCARRPPAAASSRLLAWTITCAPSRPSRSAIAAPMPPLAPVTRARLRGGAVLAHRAAASAVSRTTATRPRGQLAAAVRERERRRGCGRHRPAWRSATDDAARRRSAAGRSSRRQRAEAHVARAGQEAGRGARAGRLRQQSAPCSAIGLRRVLDRRAGQQAARAAQRMARVAVVDGAAFDARRVPRRHAVEQAHRRRGAGSARRCRRGRALPASWLRWPPSARRVDGADAAARSRTACRDASARLATAKPSSPSRAIQSASVRPNWRPTPVAAQRT